MAKVVGLSRPTYSLMENGKAEPVYIDVMLDEAKAYFRKTIDRRIRLSRVKLKGLEEYAKTL